MNQKAQQSWGHRPTTSHPESAPGLGEPPGSRAHAGPLVPQSRTCWGTPAQQAALWGEQPHASWRTPAAAALVGTAGPAHCVPSGVRLDHGAGRPPHRGLTTPTAAAGPAQMPACRAGGTGCSGSERTAGQDGLTSISPKTRQRFRACPSFQGGYLALNCLQVTRSKRQEGHGARAGGQHWGLRVPQDQVLTHPCPGPGQAGVMAKAARHHSRGHPHAVHVPSFPQSPRWDGRGRTCFSWSRRRSSVTPRARMPRARHAACSSLTLRLSTPSSEISCKESPPSSEEPLEVHGAYGPHLGALSVSL